MNRFATSDKMYPLPLAIITLTILLSTSPRAIFAAAEADSAPPDVKDFELKDNGTDVPSPQTKSAEQPPAEFEELPVAALTEHLFKQIKAQNTTDCWQSVTRLVRLARSHGAVVTDR